jgi:glycosyltransferase involved in cell wall biosynthesis
MKILIAAFACSPYEGSEPGVGWAAVCRIAMRHDVWVLADDANRSNWEKGAREKLIPTNVQVRFLRKFTAYSENRLIARCQSWLRYASFSQQVLGAALMWHKEIGFDLCHQVTIAAWRIPSPLWQLPIPFVWGPVGGAGHIPPAFRAMLSPQARTFEAIRDLSTWYAKQSKAFRDCITNTSVVIAANQETQNFLIPFRGDKSMFKLNVSSISASKVAEFRPLCNSEREGPLRLFAGGNMVGGKGISLALKALDIVAREQIDFEYTVAGGGPEVEAMKILANKLGIADKVTFHSGYSGDAYIRALQESEVYFLPSLRETMGMTLVEAILAGCYPVVADISAQGEIVRMVGGTAIKADTMHTMIRGLADGILWCAHNRRELHRLATGFAEKIAEEFSAERYDAILEHCYDLAKRR